MKCMTATGIRTISEIKFKAKTYKYCSLEWVVTIAQKHEKDEK